MIADCLPTDFAPDILQSAIINRQFAKATEFFKFTS